MRLLAAHNVSVLVSLDGPRSEHDRSRRYADGSPSYHAVMGRLREYRDRYSAFYVSHVSFNAVGSPATDLLELDRFFSQNALCKDNTVRLGSVADGHVSFLDTCPRNPLLAGQQALLSQQYCDARVRGHEPGKIASALYEQSITLFHKRRVVSGPVENPNTLSGCVPGCRKMYVATDGAIHMCERVGRGLSIGHVYHGIDVERLTQHFSMYAEFMSNEDCLGRWAFWLCTCCMAHVDDAQGFSIERKTRYCTAAKLTAMNTIMQYCVVLEQNPDAWAYLDRVSIG